MVYFTYLKASNKENIHLITIKEAINITEIIRNSKVKLTLA